MLIQERSAHVYLQRSKKAEAAVEACEEVLSKLQDELNDPAIAASYSKLQEAQKKVDAKEEELNGLMEVWGAG